MTLIIIPFRGLTYHKAGHWHYTSFASFELLNKHEETVIKSVKQAFCLVDLTALDDKLTVNPPMDRSEHKKAWNSIWKAFAKFGMGHSAQSNGSQLSGIKTDFSVPT